MYGASSPSGRLSRDCWLYARIEQPVYPTKPSLAYQTDISSAPYPALPTFKAIAEKEDTGLRRSRTIKTSKTVFSLTEIA
jgi:hypothetical protein